jgi:uncharacterized damage-inducible protein DinB
MYLNIGELLTDLQNEFNATLRVLNALTDESLNQKVYSEGRSLGKIAWHITATVPELLSQIGLEFNSEINELEVPSSINIITNTYKDSYNQVFEQIKTKIKDEDLNRVVNLYGENWTIGNAFQMLIRHEIHHRAQITVLMRQAGLKVPGLYGPSKEEWSELGRETLS